MKKKAALLLALVMVFSMLPMTAFGQPSVPPTPGVPSAGSHAINQQEQNVSFEFNAGSLRNANPAMTLLTLTLDGGHNSEFHFSPDLVAGTPIQLNARIGSTQQFIDWLEGDTSVTGPAQDAVELAEIALADAQADLADAQATHAEAVAELNAWNAIGTPAQQLTYLQSEATALINLLVADIAYVDAQIADPNTDVVTRVTLIDVVRPSLVTAHGAAVAALALVDAAAVTTHGAGLTAAAGAAAALVTTEQGNVTTAQGDVLLAQADLATAQADLAAAIVTAGVGLSAHVVDRLNNGRTLLIGFGGLNPLANVVNGFTVMYIPTVIGSRQYPSPYYPENEFYLLARLDTEVVGAGARNIFQDFRARLDLAVASRDITFGTVTPRDFATEILPVPYLRVNENTFRNFGRSQANLTPNTVQSPNLTTTETGWTMVRLEAPSGYRWHLQSGFQPFIRRIGYQHGHWATQPNNIPWASLQYEERMERVGNNDFHVLYLNIPTPVAHANQVVSIARAFEIRNLNLVATDTAPATGPINIHLSTLRQVPLAQDPGNRVIRPRSENEFFQATNILVGNRVNEGLGIRLLENDHPRNLPPVRTGYLGRTEEPSHIMDLTPGSIGTNAQGQAIQYDQWGIKTATVEIRELAPAAWGRLLGDVLDFTFEQEGVAVVGAAARAGWGPDYRNNLFPRGVNSGVDEDHRDYNRAWSGGFMTYGETILGQSTVEGTGAYVDINMNRVRVTVPQINYGTGDALTTRRFANTRVLEVVFWVTVAGGFEANNPNTDIYVTIRNQGAAGLPDGIGHTIAVATPVDPARISLVDGPVEFQTDVLSTVANHPISDIEITIYEPHTLSPGYTIQVHVGGVDAANRAFGLHAFAQRAVLTSGTGLVLGPINRPAAQGATATAGTPFEFEILQVPQEHQNSGPAVITIENVTVSGTVIPNVEYYVIVSGEAFAYNWHNQAGSPGVGRFASIPYHEFAGAYYTGILDGNVGGGGGLGQPGEVLELVLWYGMPSRSINNEPIPVPFMWYYNFPGLRAAMVNPRVFADAFGLELVWSDAARQWTITSPEGVVVVGTLGSASAMVDGVEVDIATFVNFNSGPAGSVSPVVVNDRSFLPVRFFANAFGLNVDLGFSSVLNDYMVTVRN